MVGEIVGSYQIERELGIGGMGAVYLAKHTILDKWAAVKMLRPQWSKDPEAVGRFFTEATATTAVRHGGIVDVYDFGHHKSGSAFLVMELLEGETLGERLRRDDRLPEHLALTFAWQAARALAAAHAADIVHRDLKPDNIFLCDDQAAVGGVRVKLLDFGIAKLRKPGARTHTAPEEIVGTPLYMSPEHCVGKELDGRSDVYSIACVLFQAISGRPPFCSDEYPELLSSHVGETPPHLTEVSPQTRAEVSDLVFRCLAKDPNARPDARELAEMLRSLADAPLEVTVPPQIKPAARPETRPPTETEKPSSWMTWPRAAVAAAVVLLLGLGTVVVIRAGSDRNEKPLRATEDVDASPAAAIEAKNKKKRAKKEKVLAKPIEPPPDALAVNPVEPLAPIEAPLKTAGKTDSAPPADAPPVKKVVKPVKKVVKKDKPTDTVGSKEPADLPVDTEKPKKKKWGTLKD